MTPEETVREQAQKLGGGWRMEHGVIPVVVLTTFEAGKVIERLERNPEPAAIRVELDGKPVFFKWEDVELIFTDGRPNAA